MSRLGTRPDAIISGLTGGAYDARIARVTARLQDVSPNMPMAFASGWSMRVYFEEYELEVALVGRPVADKTAATRRLYIPIGILV